MTIKVDGVDLSQWKSTERSVWGKGSCGSNHLVTLVKKSPMEFQRRGKDDSRICTWCHAWMLVAGGQVVRKLGNKAGM